VLDGRLGLGVGVERASAVSILRLLSDFLGPWMISFAWGVWLSFASLLDLFFLCCRPRLSASFCFYQCGDVSLEAHYPELVPGYLQRASRHLGGFVRSGSGLALLNRVHDPHNVRSKIRVDVVETGREALDCLLESCISAYVVLHFESELPPERRPLNFEYHGPYM
jgi:hypothetical protein